MNIRFFTTEQREACPHKALGKFINVLNRVEQVVVCTPYDTTPGPFKGRPSHHLQLIAVCDTTADALVVMNALNAFYKLGDV